MYRTSLSITITAGLALVLPACQTTQQNYHPDPISGPAGSKSAVWKTAGGTPYFGFVEFDDMGERWDSSVRAARPGEAATTQLQAVTRAIKQAGGGGGKPFYLVIFAHGWNNNAKPGNGNMEDFHARISKLRELHENDGVGIFGVFVAWRGDAPFKILNFYHRSEGGHRVGERVTGALYDLIAAGREASTRSKVALIGHSFGAHLIESGMLPVLAADVSRARLAGGSKPLAADLVLLVNPARSSLYSKPFIDQLRDGRVKVENETGPTPHPLPLIVSVTSKGDTATGRYFPLGYWLGRRISLFNTSVSGIYREPEHDPAPQKFSHQHTSGWNLALHSHTVVEEPYNSSSGSDPKVEPAEPLADEARIRPEDRPFNRMIRANYQPWQSNGSILIHGLKQNYCIKPVPHTSKNKPYNDTPYWIMQVPVSMIKNHTDVWNPEYIALVTALLYLPAPQRTEIGRDPVKTPPPQSISRELSTQKLMLRPLQ